MAASPIKFVVIGAPGHGKSTVLNEFAENDELFEVGCKGNSCTQVGGEWDARNSREIQISDGEKMHTLILKDTPGFPDTNPDKAAQYYDHVVAQCNEPINGVLFILKPERETLDVLERYAVLLKEFVHLEVPLIIIANGCEVKGKRDKGPAWEAKRTAGEKAMKEIARNIEIKAQLHAREILVSYTKDDLTDLAKHVLSILASSEPRPSNLRTFAEMERLMKEAENIEVAAQQKVEHEERRIQKCKEDIKSLEEEIAHLNNVAKGTCWIPFVGAISGAICIAKVVGKTQRIQELCMSIGDAERAKKAAGNLEAMKQETQFLQAAFSALARYLRRP